MCIDNLRSFHPLFLPRSYELCHQLLVVRGQKVGIEFTDENARLAAEFMQEMLKSYMVRTQQMV